MKCVIDTFVTHFCPYKVIVMLHYEMVVCTQTIHPKSLKSIMGYGASCNWCLFPAGPYMLGFGLLTYMLSKEIYIINHETLAALSIGAVLVYGVKKFGPDVAAFADKLNEVSLV